MAENIRTPETNQEANSIFLKQETVEIPSDFIGSVDLRLGLDGEESELHIIRTSDLPKNERGESVYNGIRINPNKKLLIVGAGGEDKIEFKGLRLGERVGIGRNPSYGASEKFPSLAGNNTVSRQHLIIGLHENGRLFIHDHSSNGTTVSYNTPPRSETANSWDTVGKDSSVSWDDLQNYRPDLEAGQQPDVEKSDDLEKFSERVRRIAAPLKRALNGDLFQQPTEDNDSNKYDHLFKVDDDDDYPRKDVERAAVRISARENVSESSVTESIDHLEQLKYNVGFQSLVDRHHQYDERNPEDTINELRRNHVLRCELINMFMRSVDEVRSVDPTSLAERVRYNDPDNLKEANSDGYENIGKMRSSEYVALLMLSMLDGSFDSSRAETVQSHTKNNGAPGFGQHREAAVRVLDYIKSK